MLGFDVIVKFTLFSFMSTDVALLFVKKKDAVSSFPFSLFYSIYATLIRPYFYKAECILTVWIFKPFFAFVSKSHLSQKNQLLSLNKPIV